MSGRRRSTGWAAALVVVAAACTSGCGDQLGSARGDRVLRGGIRYVGGPNGAVDNQTYQPGRVDVTRDGQKADVAQLKPGERYEFNLRPGEYRLSTELGDAGCNRDVVIARASVDVDLICPIK